MTTGDTLRSRLCTPSRERLLADFVQMEHVSRFILAAELVLGCIGLWLWLQQPLKHDWLVSLWVGGVGFFGMFYPFFYAATAQNKALSDIKPEARLGQHSRDSLLALVHRLCSKMQLPHGATRVYLAREKEVNAYALRAEFLPGLRMFNSVQLNRGIVHLLNEAELESVVAHELGHVWLYSPLLTRCYLIHAVVAATVSLGLLSFFPVGMEWGLMLPFFLHWALGKVLAYPWARMGRGIEFLCDDAGLRCAGLLPAITAELKMAMEAETRQQLFAMILRAKHQGMSTSLADLVEVYEQALPFGQTAGTAAEARLKSLLRETQAKESRVSLAGFFKDVWSGSSETDQQELAQEELSQQAALSTYPLLDWDRSSLSHNWTEQDVEQLVRLIETHPDQLLVRLASEVNDRGISHPSHSRRILYLWRNQAAVTC
jgi:Zn-dependent protease with chaperone function